MTEAVLIVLMIGIYLVARPVGVRLDRERIRKHLRQQGGEVLEVRRSVFGKGWAYTRERIYKVHYKDADGNLHAGTCKTSGLLGVSWAEDRVTRLGKPSASPQPEGHEHDANPLGVENERRDNSHSGTAPSPASNDEEPSYWTL